MKYSKLMIISIIFVFIYAISTACAADVNETTIATESNNQMELTVNLNEIQTDNTENLNAKTNAETQSSDEGTYSQLRDDINSGGNLTKKYYRYNTCDGDTIKINTQGVINGNGAVIDMTESNIRAFYVNSAGVTINNLTIKNANEGAIYFCGSGTVTNCNFTDNHAGFGGAIYFCGSGAVTNCNFINNSASFGGAIHMYGSGSVTNCNFINNTATTEAGAIRMGSSNVKNCNFINNKATSVYSEGGAMVLFSYGMHDISGCNFNGNMAYSGSAIYIVNKPSSVSISNSCFLNNRANADTLDINLIGTNIEIIFKGQNTLINAIRAFDASTKFSFHNVEYWGANGVVNTDFILGFLPTTNAEAGQNIRVNVIVNDKVVLNEVKITNSDGKIVLNDVDLNGKYSITAIHDEDSYYTGIETNKTNM